MTLNRTIGNEFVFRVALPSDIEQIQRVRNAVKENKLADPSQITDSLCLEFITSRGKGWVCTSQKKLVGFSIVDLEERNVWALFVDPQFEKRGIGKSLQKLMLDWYFKQTSDNIWLGTASGTRAQTFYTASGWTRAGNLKNGDVKYEMTCDQWTRLNS